MREISFRAWDKKNKQMHYNFQINNLIENTFNGELFDLDNNNNILWMQYTGLKDMNGKKIYEGDIIKKNFVRRNLEIDYDVYKVVWNEEYASFFLGSRDHRDWLHEGQNEIIGNIYENPELLEKYPHV